MKRTAVLIGLAGLLVLVSASLAAGTPSVEWAGVASGGGRDEVGDYTLNGTIGQAVVGLTTNVPYDLCVGLWCGGGGRAHIYLPLVLREY